MTDWNPEDYQGRREDQVASSQRVAAWCVAIALALLGGIIFVPFVLSFLFR